MSEVSRRPQPRRPPRVRRTTSSLDDQTKERARERARVREPRPSSPPSSLLRWSFAEGVSALSRRCFGVRAARGINNGRMNNQSIINNRSIINNQE